MGQVFRSVDNDRKKEIFGRENSHFFFVRDKPWERKKRGRESKASFDDSQSSFSQNSLSQ